MAFRIEDFHDLIHLLEEHPQWRAELRRLLLTDEVLDLPQIVRDLAEAQRETERRIQSLTDRIEALANRVQDLTDRLDALARQVQDLTDRLNALARQVQDLTDRLDALTRQVQDLTADVHTLLRWQKGEAGRRRGERYERNIIRRAPLLFGGGAGGTTDTPQVQERLGRWLRDLFDRETLLPPEEDPMLADLIWWKGDQVVVAEVSITVDETDVRQAVRRARTLRSLGVDAAPAVIGEKWDASETRTLAEELGVWWLVRGVPSEAFRAFRKRSSDGDSESFRVTQ
jgi:polyhydroxyalkanoate synthesis regulator phasin